MGGAQSDMRACDIILPTAWSILAFELSHRHTHAATHRTATGTNTHTPSHTHTHPHTHTQQHTHTFNRQFPIIWKQLTCVWFSSPVRENRIQPHSSSRTVVCSDQHPVPLGPRYTHHSHTERPSHDKAGLRSHNWIDVWRPFCFTGHCCRDKRPHTAHF